jgi:hypothetical protein
MRGEHRIVWSFASILLVCGALALTIQHRDRVGDLNRRMDARLRNLSTATRIEIHDRASQRVLFGEFRPHPLGASTEAVQSAPLMASVGDAVGRAEIELVRHPNGALVQELEVDVAGLVANASFDVTIDGEWIGTFQTDHSGIAELEQFGRVNDVPKSGD